MMISPVRPKTRSRTGQSITRSITLGEKRIRDTLYSKNLAYVSNINLTILIADDSSSSPQPIPSGCTSLSRCMNPAEGRYVRINHVRIERQSSLDADGQNLYIANHAYSVVDLPLEEGQSELQALLDHAAQAKYVCPVQWNDPGDLGKHAFPNFRGTIGTVRECKLTDSVIWDNTCVL
jgi:hypothetical protein